MANPFGTKEMAAGYATSRPPVHSRILERVRPHLPAPILRALDVGCGAGLSTQALRGLANHCIGLEPVESMLHWTATVAPEAEFIVGAAEAMPIAARSVDLMTAAGSLNYVNLELFFTEAARVLAPDGVLVVYDFSPATTFPDGPGLEDWFASFLQRYPPPVSEARPLDPTVLAQVNSGFSVRTHDLFDISITLSPAFYLDYMMTETNVAFAVRRGVSQTQIRSWCEDTVRPLWNGREREVVFHGYFVCMTPVRQQT